MLKGRLLHKDGSQEIGSSKNFRKETIFKNALIQNIAGGNTIVMNKKARNLVVKSLICDKYISHDWWCYQMISAAGGEIIFNSKKFVRYRQHGKNLIGGNDRLIDKLKRFKIFFSGVFKKWTDINIKNLKKNRTLINKENFETLQKFIKAREAKSPLKRLIFYLRSGVFRQTSIENFIFIIGMILKKI